MGIDYVITCDDTYIKLDEFYDSFAYEAYVINEAKCHLANYGNLDDFDLDGISIIKDNDDYYLYCNEMTLYLETSDLMIVDYSVQ